MRQWMLGAAGGLLVTLAAGCGATTCKPVPVTVAQKEERARLEMVPTGGFSSQTGGLSEVKTPKAVRDFWVKGQDGTWYPISAERYQAVAVGDTVELCR